MSASALHADVSLGPVRNLAVATAFPSCLGKASDVRGFFLRRSVQLQELVDLLQRDRALPEFDAADLADVPAEGSGDGVA